MDSKPASELTKDIDERPVEQTSPPLGAQIIRKMKSTKRSEHGRGWHFAPGFIGYFSEVLAIFRPPRGPDTLDRTQDETADVKSTPPQRTSSSDAISYDA